MHLSAHHTAGPLDCSPMPVRLPHAASDRLRASLGMLSTFYRFNWFFISISRTVKRLENEAKEKDPNYDPDKDTYHLKDDGTVF